MPRAPKSQSQDIKPKPYDLGQGSNSHSHAASSDEYDTKPYIKSRTQKAPGRTWTGDELVTLFEIALGKGPPKTAFEGALPDRSALQAHKTWQ